VKRGSSAAGSDAGLIRPLDATRDGLCRSVHDGTQMDIALKQDGT